MALLRDDMTKAARAAAIVKALAHPLRLRMVALLCEGELGADDLAARLGISTATVARQLEPLVAQGLVAAGPGRWTRYRVSEPVVHGLVACMDECSR
jgi:ArsR family transcriptional regulator